MNFIRWDIIQEPQWIADHTTLQKCHAEYTYNKFGQITGVNYSQDATATTYDQYVFSAEYQYMLDWLNSRVAWMSNEYIKDYTPQTPDGMRGDADFDQKVTILDASSIQLHLAKLITMSDVAVAYCDVDDDNKLSVMDASKIQLFIAKMINEL